jgi:anti-sigma B factor antagonist
VTTAAAPAASLALHYHVADGAEVVRAAGELDICTAGPLRDLLHGLLARSPTAHVVVDLEPTTFLSAAALGVLIGGWKLARNGGGSFAVVCTSRELLKVLRITGVASALTICPSLADALAARPAVHAPGTPAGRDRALVLASSPGAPTMPGGRHRLAGPEGGADERP